MTKVFDATKFRKSITKSIQGLGIGFSDPTDWISTGNYALNYLMTSDFNKGIPLGKVTVLAGESGAGKSYIASGNIIKNAQDQGIFVILIDTEKSSVGINFIIELNGGLIASGHTFSPLNSQCSGAPGYTPAESGSLTIKSTVSNININS